MTGKEGLRVTASASRDTMATAAPALSPSINEAYLEDRLTALEAARDWSPRVASRLESLIRSPADGDLFRVNPLKFAHERNVDEREAIDLFLHATAVGIFIMDWMVLCPLCSSVIESFESLRTINSNHYHCHFCQNDHDATLDDYIVIAFTIAPKIRTILVSSAGDAVADRLS